jgi:hypothetical protein
MRSLERRANLEKAIHANSLLQEENGMIYNSHINRYLSMIYFYGRELISCLSEKALIPESCPGGFVRS